MTINFIAFYYLLIAYVLPAVVTALSAYFLIREASLRWKPLAELFRHRRVHYRHALERMHLASAKKA